MFRSVNIVSIGEEERGGKEERGEEESGVVTFTSLSSNHEFLMVS